jgi:hypothetical protein
VKLSIVPLPLDEANAFAAQHHRHHGPVRGHKFSVGVVDEARVVRGVGIVGRPVARMLDNGLTLELLRVATDGLPNACSAIYGAPYLGSVRTRGLYATDDHEVSGDVRRWAITHVQTPDLFSVAGSASLMSTPMIPNHEPLGAAIIAPLEYRTERSTQARREPTIFDAIASAEAKEAGMLQAADNKAGLLTFARTLAVEVAKARPDRCISADDVQAALVARGVSDHALGNAAGSLFRGEGWTFTGRYVQSARVGAHRNLLRVWRWTR